MAAYQRRDVQIPIRFTPEEAKAIREIAAQERRSFSDTARLLLEDAVVKWRAGAHQGAHAA